MSEFIVYTGWTLGETLMVFGIPIIMVGGILVSWLVSLRSERWANHIAGFTILLLIAWMLMAFMLWDEAWVR